MLSPSDGEQKPISPSGGPPAGRWNLEGSSRQGHRCQMSSVSDRTHSVTGGQKHRFVVPRLSRLSPSASWWPSKGPTQSQNKLAREQQESWETAPLKVRPSRQTGLDPLSSFVLLNNTESELCEMTEIVLTQASHEKQDLIKCYGILRYRRHAGPPRSSVPRPFPKHPDKAVPVLT